MSPRLIEDFLQFRTNRVEFVKKHHVRIHQFALPKRSRICQLLDVVTQVGEGVFRRTSVVDRHLDAGHVGDGVHGFPSTALRTRLSASRSLRSALISSMISAKAVLNT